MKTIEGFFIHWKTSLCGIGVAVLNAAANGTSPKQIAVSAGLALLGLFAKDGSSSEVTK